MSTGDRVAPMSKCVDRRAVLGSTLAALGLAGCARRAAPGPSQVQIVDSIAALYAPDPGLDPDRPQDDWFRAPAGRTGGFVNTMLGGQRVLQIEAASGALFGRRAELPLLGLPFLRWTWYLDPALYLGGPAEGAQRGLRLVLGFSGGAVGDRPFLGGVFLRNQPEFPDHDRRIEIAWGGQGAFPSETPLQGLSATNDRARNRQLRAPASDQTGRWRAEVIDLGELYTSFWPNDRYGETQLSFFAIGGLPAVVPLEAKSTIGYFLEVLLTR